MTAVIRPVGIDHADLGDGRVTVLRLKILLTEGNIVDIHRESVVRYEMREPLSVELIEAVKRLDSRRDLILNRQGRGLL